MTWHIPAWYWGRFSRTPYPPLNDTATPERIVGYSLAAIPIAFFSYLLLLSPEVLALRIEQVRGQSKLFLRLFELLILVLTLYAPIIAPTLVRKWLLRRKLVAMSGKCLNCCAPAPPPGVTHCIECGSEMQEQNNYRITFWASTPKLGYASLRRGPSESRGFRRLAFCASLLLPALCIVVGYWNYRLEAGGRPRLPLGFPQYLFVATMILAMIPVLLAGIWSTGNFKRNIARIRDCCLRCETPRLDESPHCSNCGDSIVSQQLFVWKRILSFSRNAGSRSHAMAACKALGIRPPMSVNAAIVSRSNWPTNSSVDQPSTSIR